MTEHKLGTFFGEDIVVKSNRDFDWAKKWENYIESIKAQAVQEYKDELLFKEADVKIAKMKSKWWYKNVFFYWLYLKLSK